VAVWPVVVAEAASVPVGGTLKPKQKEQSFRGPGGPWEWWVLLPFLGDKASRKKSSDKSTIITSKRDSMITSSRT